MITIFNRKELLITKDNDLQIKVRNILSENNIPYDLKIVNFRHRGRLGSVGENQNAACLYKIFVRNKDYKEAEYLIRLGKLQIDK